MDLIPADYRRYIQQLQLLQRWGLFTLVIIAVSVSLSLGLKYMASEYQKEIVVLEKKKAISSHQRGILQDLEKDRNQLTKKHRILEKLRGGALAEDMFVNIDRSLNGKNIWFKNWKFIRAGSKTSEKPKGVNTGYFIVIPEADRANQKEKEAWQIQTHMEVSGQATDHEALSSFVHRVLQQPQIGDVRILNTRQQVIMDKTVVDFKLVIMVNSGYANS
jgi:cell division protein FtsL